MFEPLNTTENDALDRDDDQEGHFEKKLTLATATISTDPAEEIPNVQLQSNIPAIDVTLSTTTTTSDDMNLSKRWRRNRRRGRLHKRQLEDASTDDGDGHSRNKKSKDDTKIDEDAFNETDYYFENGLRKVYPYIYTYLCYCKERWKGKTILEMLNDEFISESKERNSCHIEQGNVKVNGKVVSANYLLKGKNELISNRVHRHELPVTAQPIKIIDNNEDYLVVDKPSSIAVHPCGKYRHNSLTFILGKEYKINHLRTIYRLDRLTSGLLIFGKNHSSTNRLMDCIKQRTVTKTYLCRVEGEFPDGKVDCTEPLDRVHQKLGTWRVKEGGKASHTTFEKVNFNGSSSIVKCWPHTGRTHQIRVHLQYLGYPIINDPLYNDEVWGPEKGKGGRYHKTDEQLYADLIKNHASKLYESSEPQLTVSDSPEETPSDRPGGTLRDIRLTPDPGCQSCKKKFKDPSPEQLVMYLHALSYKGPDWEYKTDEPAWACEDWSV